MRISVIFLSFLFCIAIQAQSKRVYGFPLKKFESPNWPIIDDDLDFQWMNLAIQRQLDRFERRSMNHMFRIQGVSYPVTLLRDTLKAFDVLSRDYQQCVLSTHRSICRSILKSQLQQRFDLYYPDVADRDPQGSALFTAYYTPTLHVTTQPQPGYSYPIFSKPSDRAVAQAYTREEIDFDGRLSGMGLELFYADNLFDLYLLQVEGGGHVVIKDQQGKSQYLSYDGTNRKSFNFISRYMMSQGYIDSHSVAAQRRFLDENPDKQREVYAYCPSYVYFRKSDTPPVGSDSVPLTDNRSMAQDDELYGFKGLLGFVQAKRPTGDGQGAQPFSRFYIDQDTGGAIVGRARADLYFGEGEYAELAATTLKNRGEIYFLLLKQ